MKNLLKKSTFLFETIKIVDKKPLNLNYHIKRASNSVKYPLKFDFEKILNCHMEGIVKAKVIYDEYANLIDVQYFLYEFKKCCNFTLVDINFNYEKKFLDRTNINKVKNGFEEIIMIKNSLVTDTSIANIAIFDRCWISPKTPLLKGTLRQSLVDNNFLRLKDISVKELLNAKRFAVMNAMIGFLEVENFKFDIDL